MRKHELNLLVAVHVCHDCNEVFVELLGDKLNAKSEALELPHNTEEDIGKENHDHQWVCAAYSEALFRESFFSLPFKNLDELICVLEMDTIQKTL